MKMTEIEQRTDEELHRLVDQLRQDIYNLRVRKITNQLDNTASLRSTRRDLARASTAIALRAKSTSSSAGDDTKDKR